MDKDILCLFVLCFISKSTLVEYTIYEQLGRRKFMQILVSFYEFSLNVRTEQGFKASLLNVKPHSHCQMFGQTKSLRFV